jgi:hypothetical protein
MIDVDTHQFYDLLRNWHWGDPSDLIIDKPTTLGDLARQFSIEGANLALQEVLNEFQNGGCSLGLDINNGHLVLVASLFDGDMELTKVLDKPFSDIALDVPEMARDIARAFRKLAKQLDQAAKQAES